MNRSLVDRVKGILRLDADVYEEVEADTTALPQAAMVVAAGAVASGIGALGGGPLGMIIHLVFTFAGWLIWTVVSYFVGTRAFGGTATWDQVLRTLGFAQAPHLFGILAIIPLLGGLVGFAAGIWAIATSVVAIRQSLDLTTEKAVLTAVVSVLIILVLMAIPATLFGVGALAFMLGS